MDVFSLRMPPDALRQMLSDRSDDMSQEQTDEVLDQISLLTELIELLEKRLK